MKRSISAADDQESSSSTTTTLPLEKKPRLSLIQTDKVKLLVCGDVNGQFDRLFTKVAQVNEKHGPFTCLLCTGKFYFDHQTSSSSLSSSENNYQQEQEELEYSALGGADSLKSMDYLKGVKAIPIPTYFVDSSHRGVMSGATCQQLTHNLTFLGGYGVLNDFCGIEGLSIAFLGGSYDRYAYRASVDAHGSNLESNHYTQSIISNLERQILNVRSQSKRSIDILLTCEWPAHVLNCLPNNRTVTNHRRGLGSFSVTRIAQKAVPKYHFAAMEGFFFERLPYQTKVESQPSSTFITRFLGLAQVKEEIGEQKKVDKFLYAINMSMRDSGQTIPEGTTPSPYEEPSKEREVKSDASSKKQSNERRHDKVLTSNTSECWFCLKNTKLETHLLVSIGDESYLAFPKGGLTEEHLLIIPFSHSAYFGQCSLATQQEMMRFLGALKKFFEQDNKSVILFERNVSFTSRPVHMILNVIAVPKDIDLESCKQRFLEDIAEKNGVPPEEVVCKKFDANVTNKDCINQFIVEHPKTDYLLVQFPDETKAMYSLTGNVKATANAGRTACRKLLGLAEEKDDWRKCSEGKEKESECVSAFKKKFAHYDFTL